MTSIERGKPRRAFAAAWLAGDAQARSFLDAAFEGQAARAAAVRAAAARRCDPSLVDFLRRWHEDLPPSPERSRNLEALASGDAAVVVAGQQVGLFTGPAFSFYKAAGAVAAAARLERESGLRCVPVFWLQTEDHDYDEIDHCWVRGEGGAPRRIALPGGDPSPRVSVAHRRLDAGVTAALAEFADVVRGRAGADEAVALLARHYRPGATFACAFAGVLDEIFAADGLLFLDPRSPEVAALARPLHERALREAGPIAGDLAERAAALEDAGFAVQVPIRPGAPLCFFHPEGAEGPRYRLAPDGEALRVCTGEEAAPRVTVDDLLHCLESDPLRLSSSALLRPLVQDFLLPVAMTLAGPGEIAYFAELAPLYRRLAVAMPALAPRPSLCVTSAADRRRLEATGLRFEEVPGERGEVLARVRARLRREEDGIDEAEVDALGAAFAQQLDSFAQRVEALDARLARPLEKTKASVAAAFARLSEHWRRALLESDAVAAARVERLRDALAPDGRPQERVYGLASLAADHGLTRLAAAVRGAVAPLDPRTKEVAL